DEKCGAENDPKPNRIRRQLLSALGLNLCAPPLCSRSLVSSANCLHVDRGSAIIDRAGSEIVCPIELSPSLVSLRLERRFGTRGGSSRSMRSVISRRGRLRSFCAT